MNDYCRQNIRNRRRPLAAIAVGFLHMLFKLVRRH